MAAGGGDLSHRALEEPDGVIAARARSFEVTGTPVSLPMPHNGDCLILQKRLNGSNSQTSATDNR
jgi:hypothetical protein